MAGDELEPLLGGSEQHDRHDSAMPPEAGDGDNWFLVDVAFRGLSFSDCND